MSVPFTLRELLTWTGGRLRSGPAEGRFAGVSIDTRSIEAGQLFVAIRGPQHDAHRFSAQALARGASGLLVCAGAELGGPVPDDLPVVEVEDTTPALGALAAGHRKGFEGPVVAITGSNGKTTSKEMCAAILAVAGPCLKTRGNLNNEYGVPLTLLGREPGDCSAVVELGMNHRGEISRLAAIACPDVGLLTNIGTAHIGNLGSREAIAEEKGDLFAALPATGTAVVNVDDPRVAAQARRSAARRLHFGVAPEAEVRAEDIRFLSRGAHAFTLRTPGGAREIEVEGLAETTVINALGAAAAALAAGAGLDQVVAGLAAWETPAGRMASLPLAAGLLVIDDTYNANPQSLRAGLESLGRRPGRARAVAVLGDMGELGERSEAAHLDAGRWSAELGVSLLCAVGDRAEDVARGAREAGLATGSLLALPAGDPEGAAKALAERLLPGDWVLVKGSRAMRMEEIVRALARLWAERHGGEGT